MEEILASIKRVIAEETPPPPARSRSARKADPDPVSGDDDVLELDQPLGEAGALVSEDAAVASRQSLAALSALSQQNPQLAAGGGPLEAVVREMLRPMLKQWLDDNLPRMVEEMVVREIARITGRSL